MCSVNLARLVLVSFWKNKSMSILHWKSRLRLRCEPKHLYRPHSNLSDMGQQALSPRFLDPPWEEWRGQAIVPLWFGSKPCHSAAWMLVKSQTQVRSAECSMDPLAKLRDLGPTTVDPGLQFRVDAHAWAWKYRVNKHGSHRPGFTTQCRHTQCG